MPDRTPAPAASAYVRSVLAPPQAGDEIGRLGPYAVLGLLGEGGMGLVFRARDTGLNREVALKVVRPEYAARHEASERFLREARSAAMLDHEHIVGVYQVGEADVPGAGQVPYIAMQLLRGESLEDRLRRSGLPVVDALRVGAEVAAGLAHAHEKGLAHRDIKPANVWLDGDRGRVKLLDFGLARADSDAAGVTRANHVVGTPAYMAPEQARGKPEPRSDLFALGVILYRGLCGKLPFAGEDTVALLLSVATDTPAPPRELNKRVPGPLSDLILQLLSKKAEDRPPARQVANQLEAWLAKAQQQMAERGLDPTASGGRLARPPLPEPTPAPAPAPEAPADVWAAAQSGTAESPLRKPKKGGAGLAVVASAAAVLLAAGGAAAVWLLAGPKPKTVAETPKPAAEAKPPAETAKPAAPEPGLEVTPPPEPPQLAAGRPVEVPFRLKRTNLPGDVTVTLLGLPEGLKVTPEVVRKGGTEGKLLVTAGDSAAAGEFAVRLVAKGEGASAEAGTVVKVARAAGDGTVTVVPSRPRIEVPPGEMPRPRRVPSLQINALGGGTMFALPPGGTGSLRMVVTRRDYEGPIEFVPDGDLPPGVTVAPLKLPADRERCEVNFAVAPGAEVGRREVRLVAVLPREQGPALRLPLRFTVDVTAPTAEVRRLGDDSDRVDALAVTPDGKRLLAGTWHVGRAERARGEQFRVEVWNTETGELEKSLAGHTQPVKGIDVSPDGRFAVSGGYDSTVRVWDLKTGTAVQSLGLRNQVRAVTYSPGGRRVLAAAGDELFVWDAKTYKVVGKAELKPGPVEAARYTPDGRLVLTGGADGAVYLADPTLPGRRPRALAGMTETVGAVAVSPDGKLAAAGGGELRGRDGVATDYSARVWDVATGKLVYHTGALSHDRPVSSVAFAGGGKYLLTASRGSGVRVWDVRNKKEVFQFTNHRSDVYCVVVLPGGKLAASGGHDGVRIWKLPAEVADAAPPEKKP